MFDINVCRGIIRTLNTIPVTGKSDCAKMLGCINALESFLEPPREEPNVEEEVNG